ncbi:MAG: methylmalonyl-CoA epimerase [Bacteroidota bacterium]|nr:methylmalonyl-CoA epimerase [Bacteroidota bacterium]
MPKKLEHIGIAVKDLGKSEVLFEKLLNTSSYKREEVASEGVITSFFQIGEIKIELLAATTPDSPIAKFIDKKGEGIHHLAFESDSINDELEHLNYAGIELIHQQPKDGADNKEIAFLHPKSTGGVLWELCQEKKA